MFPIGFNGGNGGGCHEFRIYTVYYIVREGDDGSCDGDDVSVSDGSDGGRITAVFYSVKVMLIFEKLCFLYETMTTL